VDEIREKQNKNVGRRKIEKQNKNVGWVIRGNSIVALFSLWVNSILIKFARGPGFDSQLPPIFILESVYLFV
jgi:hypothetical protein